MYIVLQQLYVKVCNDFVSVSMRFRLLKLNLSPQPFVEEAKPQRWHMPSRTVSPKPDGSMDGKAACVLLAGFGHLSNIDK